MNACSLPPTPTCPFTAPDPSVPLHKERTGAATERKQNFAVLVQFVLLTPPTFSGMLRFYFLQGIKFLTPKQDGFERDFSPGTHSVT